MGATLANMACALPISPHCRHLHITQLEMLNVGVDLKVWATVWSNKLIDIKCDNSAVVEVLTSSKILLFGVLRCFQHETGHITMGSWKGRRNQYTQFVRVLYCKLPTNGKQLPAFLLEAVPGIGHRGGI